MDKASRLRDEASKDINSMKMDTGAENIDYTKQFKSLHQNEHLQRKNKIDALCVQQSVVWANIQNQQSKITHMLQSFIGQMSSETCFENVQLSNNVNEVATFAQTNKQLPVCNENSVLLFQQYNGKAEDHSECSGELLQTFLKNKSNLV